MAREKPGKWIVTNADILNLPYADGSFGRRRLFRGPGASSRRRRRRSGTGPRSQAGRDLVVTVPRFFPNVYAGFCPRHIITSRGGHIRIYKKGELMSLLEEAGARCWRIRYRHGLHAPYWWLRCLVGHKNETSQPSGFTGVSSNGDILRHPPLTTMMDKILNPLIGKSIIFYLKKGYR